MKRTKLADRTLPDYTRGEEIMNMTTHIVGGGVGIVVLILSILISVSHANVWGVVSGAIYGASMIALYSVSSIYHGLRPSMGKKVMQVVDHCTIYFLIAGTYTPILLSAIRKTSPVIAWVIFGIEWGLVAFAVTMNAIDLERFKVPAMICYIGMGWCIIFVVGATIKAMTTSGFLWLLAGGVAYTIGAVFYLFGRKRRYIHSVFHIFVVVGSILQAVGILLYVY